VDEEIEQEGGKGGLIAQIRSEGIRFDEKGFRYGCRASNARDVAR